MAPIVPTAYIYTVYTQYVLYYKLRNIQITEYLLCKCIYKLKSRVKYLICDERLGPQPEQLSSE